MNAGIFSLYWDNIDERVVKAQKKVCDHLGVPVQQQRINGIDHGEWIDWVMHRENRLEDVIFLDIDCIPLNKGAIHHALMWAGGALYGAQGAANHIDPSRSYAGAWYIRVPRETWIALGKPSAKADSTADVCQRWTEVWTQAELPTLLIEPTACEHPKWDLPGRPKAYGIGTTYGDYCYHLFESRGQNPQPFLDKCAQVLNAAH